MGGLQWKEERDAFLLWGHSQLMGTLATAGAELLLLAGGERGAMAALAGLRALLNGRGIVPEQRDDFFILKE